MRDPNGKDGSTSQRSNHGRKIWILAVMIAFVVGIQVGLSLHTAQVTTTVSHSDNKLIEPFKASMQKDTEGGTLTSKTIKNPTKKSVSGVNGKDSFGLAYEQSFGFFDDINDYNWNLLRQRARGRIHHRFKDPLKFYWEPARWYMNNFEPDFTCGQERRIVGPGDGPKWVCDPHRLPIVAERRKKELGDDNLGCLIYSVGSGGKFQFEDGLYEMLDGQCEIHIFDPGNFAKERPDLEERNMIFHKWGFRSTYDDTYTPTVDYGVFYTLNETLKMLGHENRPIDVFKIDCEFCEWYSFRDWFKADIRQLLVETHSLPATKELALDYFYGFQENNFYMFHKEPNIHPRAHGEGIEWAYVRLHPDFFKNDTTPEES